MTIEFEYTFDDFKEAQAAHSRQQWKPQGGASKFRGLIGWIIFVSLAVLLFMLLQKTPSRVRVPAPAAPPPNPAASPLLDYIIPLVPWLLIFGFIWFFVFRQLRGGGSFMKKVWEDQSFLQLRRTLDLDANRVILDDVQSRTESQWIAFTRFTETKNLFLLYQGPYAFIIIPKRAIATAADEEEFRRLVTENVQPETRAFPVQPVQRP